MRLGLSQRQRVAASPISTSSRSRPANREVPCAAHARPGGSACASPGLWKAMMERCPTCGTPARPGAKFCTTCGFRFPGDASDGESAHEHTDTATSTTDEDPGLFPGAMTDGWPSPSPPEETVGGGWDTPAAA